MICALSLLLLVAEATTVVSCAEKELSAANISNGMNATKVPMEFNTDAATVGTSTRTSINADLQVLWSENDAICIFDGQSNNEFTLASGVGEASGRFTGEAYASGTYYALYPYSAEAKCESGVITSELPSEQTAVAGSFDTMLSPAVGSSEGNGLALENVAGLIAFELKDIPEGKSVKRVSFNAESSLAGNYTVDASGSPMTAAEGNPLTGVTVSAGNGLQELTEGETYYAVVIPGTYSNFTSTVTFSDGTTFLRQANRPVTIAANGGVSLPVLASAENAVYEWSPGYLTVDENGYRFTDTDSENGTESLGMYFRYHSAYALETGMDVAEVNDWITAWYLDETDGKYKTRTVSFSEIPKEDTGDPCSRVPVAEGESKWMTPTLSQWKSWAYKTEQYSAMVSYNNQDERGVYAVYDTDPSENNQSPMYIFASGFVPTTGGKWQRSDFCAMWIESGNLENGSVLNYVEIKPSAASNSANPAYKTHTVSNLNTQAMQIRCIREVK